MTRRIVDSQLLHEAGHMVVNGSLRYVTGVDIRHDKDGTITLLTKPALDQWPLEDAITSLIAGAAAELFGSGWPAKYLTVSDCRLHSEHAEFDFQLLDALVANGMDEALIATGLTRALALLEQADLRVGVIEMQTIMRRIPPGRTGMVGRESVAVH